MSFINFLLIIVVSVLVASSIPEPYIIVIGHISAALIFQSILSYLFFNEEKDENNLQ
jgi:hypothetical protein